MTMPGARPDRPHHLDRRMALAREWDDLVEQVRRLPGFEDFLRPPSLDSLLPAAAEGPVAIINVSRWRCDALIVTAGGVDVVELAPLSLDEVMDRVTYYLTTVDSFQQAALTVKAAVDRYEIVRNDAAVQVLRQVLNGYELELVDLEQRLNVILEWCWDRIAEPVLHRLGLTGPPEATEEGSDASWPRLWWCPTGLLTLLPLHAAGRHEVAGDAVIDRVVSSYTPTVRALLEARRPRERGEETAGVRDALLVVAMPETDGQPPLPNVAREIAMLSDLDGIDRTVLEGPEATRAAVEGALSAHRWVHFACHGHQNLRDPSKGGVLLCDGTLTITDISARQYQGELAYLSACKTATGGIALPDEAITLAAALHYAGYRHVIATLWSIWDETAPQVAEAVYRAVADGSMLRTERSAEALHHAVRALRDEHPGEASVWTPFTHTGP